MKNITFCFILAIAVGMPIAALAVSPCPDIRIGDEKRSAKLDSSLSLVTKLLSSIGLTGEYTAEVTSRLSTSTDQVLALYQYKVVCETIYGDSTLSTEKKLNLLRAEFQSIFLISKIRPQSGSGLPPRNGGTSLFRHADLVVGMTSPSLPESEGLDILESGPRLAATLPPPPQNPPPKGATIIRVFPKKNLDVVGVIRLRRLLPNYDVRIGSSEVSSKRDADTLFVDRDKVPQEEVIEILRVLKGDGNPGEIDPADHVSPARSTGRNNCRPKRNPGVQINEAA